MGSGRAGNGLQQVAIIIPSYSSPRALQHLIQTLPRGRLMQYGIQAQVFAITHTAADSDAAREVGATIVYEPQQGNGNAVRATCRKLPDAIDYVVMLDDDAYELSELPRLLEPLQNEFCDAVVGSRLCGRHVRMNYLPRVGNWLCATGLKLIYRAKTDDGLSGYIAWKKTIGDELYPFLCSGGYVQIDMITKLSRMGYRVMSVPASYHPQRRLRPRLRDVARVIQLFVANIVWQPLSSAVRQGRKIIFVSDGIYPYMKGGKEKRLYEISRRLSRMGYDVHVYTMHWWDEPALEHVEEGVHLHAICKKRCFYKGNRRTITQAVLFGLACFKLMRVRFDVLDVDHMPFFPVFSLWAVCLLRGKRLHGTWHEVLTRHEWIEYMGPLGVIAAVIERLSIRLPHHITAASAQTQQLLMMQRGRRHRISLVASGIDMSLLEGIPPAEEGCDVLYVGRLVKDKHVELLISAIQALAEQKREASCMIIGDGPEKSRLQQQIDDNGLQKLIHIYEPMPYAESIYACMKAARVFCLPSVREGFSIATLEALGCGTPVITTDSPSNAARHLIQPNKNGSLVSLDVAQLSEVITHWLDAPKKPDMTPLIAEYDWHRIAQQQVEAYST